MSALPPEILLCDNHLLGVVKPAGVPMVPDASGDPSLLEQARAWVKRRYGKPGNVFLGVVHRLDRPVSGVAVFARTSKAAARLSDLWRRHELKRIYRGVTAGEPPGEEGRLEQWLLKDRPRNIIRAVEEQHPGARRAVTFWRVLERRAGRSLLELEPLTGRSHQLRAACAALGMPLLGDLKYGAGTPLPDRSIALHARSLAFRHPVRPETVRLEAEVPARFPLGSRPSGGG
ncbi:MAG: RluA family pseudouridine synthase [Planctomycetota bacterium]